MKVYAFRFFKTFNPTELDISIFFFEKVVLFGLIVYRKKNVSLRVKMKSTICRVIRALKPS